MFSLNQLSLTKLLYFLTFVILVVVLISILSQSTIIATVILVGIILIGYIFIRHLKNEFNQITDILRRIDNGNFLTIETTKIDLKEFVDIKNVLNNTSQRLKESYITIKTKNEQLLEQKEEFESIFKYSKDGIAILDSQSNFLDFNDAYAGFTGFSREELMKISCLELTPVEDREKSKVGLKKVFDEGSIVNFEKHCLKKDGSIMVINMSLVLMPDKKRVLVTARDITQAKLLEEKLKEQKEEFETIFNYSTDGIAIVNFESKFLKFNQAFMDMIGYDESELLQKTCGELTVSEDLERNKEFLAIAKQYGHAENFEKSCITKDGKRVMVNMSISLLPDNERLLFVVKDITLLKQFESQSKLASMGEMIGNIAHQWRQPLSVVSSIASGLSVEYSLGLDCDVTDDMNKIVQQVQYLSKTIDDFRDFIKEDLNFVQLNVKTIAEDAVNLVRATMKNNHVNLILNAEDDCIIEGNKNELVQALINILNNAKDALLENQPNEKLIFVSTVKRQDMLDLKIIDNGGGIPSHIISRVFEPYFTSKHKSIGTGIGLSMVDKIIRERHHQHISVHNEEFEYNSQKYFGACFTISFHSK